MSEKILWIKYSADFASANNVSRETIEKTENIFLGSWRLWQPKPFNE